MGEVKQCVILILEDHGSQVTRFQLKGLTMEFNLFLITINPRDSPSMMSKKLMYRFVSKESSKIYMQGVKNWCKKFVDIVVGISMLYYVKNIKWFISNSYKALRL
jgi:hypothetical protein